MQSQQQQETPSQQNQDSAAAAVAAVATGQHVQTLQSQANTLASQLKDVNGFLNVHVEVNLVRVGVNLLSPNNTT